MPQPDIATQFRYLYWIRDRALGRASELSPEAFLDPTTVAYRDLRATLVHELDVERSWRLRLQGEAREAWDVELQPSAYPDAQAIAEDWHREEEATTEWLAGLTEDDLAGAVTANRLEGFPLATYLVHVVMHGIESLSAAAILLHRAGHSMGDVGFLDFVDATGGVPDPLA
jgi:uncharacterized damage-inducible protein DinB